MTSCPSRDSHPSESNRESIRQGALLAPQLPEENPSLLQVAQLETPAGIAVLGLPDCTVPCSRVNG